jgi:hypothetical protein
MKREEKLLRYFGCSIILFAILSLLLVLWELKPVYVDFPCESAFAPQPQITMDTQIVYCISLWPRNIISGGTIYTYGDTSNTNLVIPPSEMIPSLSLVKQNDALFVNGTRLKPGENYQRFYWRLSENPWIIYTLRLRIQYTDLKGKTIEVNGDIMKDGLSVL